MDKIKEEKVDKIKEEKVNLERIELIKEWEGSPFQKWAARYIAKNLWRVREAVGDYNDCMAEAALQYIVCRKRYGLTTNSNKHFMYLYKQWFESELNTHSSKDSRNREAALSLSRNEPFVQPEAISIKLNDASSELKQIMKVILSAPQEVMDVLRAEASSCCPKQYFNAVLNFCGISKSKSVQLSTELKELLK